MPNIVNEDSVSTSELLSIVPKSWIYGIVNPTSLWHVFYNIPTQKKDAFLPQDVNWKKYNTEKKETNLSQLSQWGWLNKNSHYSINVKNADVQKFFEVKDSDEKEARRYYGKLLYKMELFRRVVDELFEREDKRLTTLEFKNIIGKITLANGYNLDYYRKFIGRTLDDGGIIEYQFMKERVILLECPEKIQSESEKNLFYFTDGKFNKIIEFSSEDLDVLLKKFELADLFKILHKIPKEKIDKEALAEVVKKAIV